MDNDFSNKPVVRSPFDDVIDTDLVHEMACDVVGRTQRAPLGDIKSVSTRAGLWSRAAHSKEAVFAAAGLRDMPLRSYSFTSLPPYSAILRALAFTTIYR